MNYELFNKNIIKIIEIFTDKEDTLYFNQISEISGITSKNNLLQNLDLLVSLNILSREQSKSNTFYKLNKDNPLTTSLLDFIRLARIYTLAKEEWYSQNCNSTPITIMSAGYSGFRIKEQTGLSYTNFLYEFKDDFGRIAYSVKDLEFLSKNLMNKLKENNKYFEELKKKYDEELKISNLFYEEIENKDISSLSDILLSNYIKKASESITRSVGVGHLIEPFAIISDRDIKGNLSRFIKDKKTLNEKFILLTTPTKKSFAQESEELLSEIFISKNKDNLVKDYQQRFFWIKNTYAGRKIISKSEILEESKVIGKNKSRENKSLTRNKEEAIKEFNLSKEIISQLNAIEFLTNWQDERKKNILIAVDYLDRLLEELSRRTKIDITLLRYLTPVEASKAIHHIIELKFELEDRRKGCLCFQLSNTTQVVSGSNYLKLKEVIEEKVAKETKVLNGNAASLGIAIGRAKVCTNLDSINKVQAGDILIASMTRPEYLPAMKKAAAFVTDEGGITCHAAIIAREMRKPCVIGTKNATQVLKDGDLIEVKGNHGIVIIRERAQAS